MRGSERIKAALSRMEDAVLFAREGMGNKAVLTKYYHAMMNCLFALLDIQDIGRLTHADIIDRYEREYVHTGKAGRGDLDVLHRSYDLTHECDCEHMPVPTNEDVAAAQHTATSLLRAVERLNRAEVKKHESSAV